MQAISQASATLSGAVVCESNRSAQKCSLKSSFSTSVGFVSQKVALRKAANKRAVVVMSLEDSPASGYASALVQVGRNTGTLEAIQKDVEALASILSDESVNGFLASPVIDEEKRKQVILSIAKESNFNAATINFLSIIADKNRLSVLGEIVAAFDEFYFAETDTQVAVVTSAVKLENSQQALIAKKLQTITGAKNIKLKNIVQPALIAGFIVNYGKDGSNEIDMSVKGQLDLLEIQFAKSKEDL